MTLIKEKQSRGRKKGELVDCGLVQVFIKNHGGKDFILNLYQRLNSADLIAEYIKINFEFYCSGNTIRNYMTRNKIYYSVKKGGDRLSPKAKANYNKRKQIAGIY